MPKLNQEHVKSLLHKVQDAHSGADIVSLGWLQEIEIENEQVTVDIRANYPADGIKEDLISRVKNVLESDSMIAHARIDFTWRVFASQVQAELKPMQGVRNIIAVASGKGGVGKSATSVNLALALQADGARVGLLDADIYGPSLPRMLGISGNPETADGRIVPQQAHGLQVMSIGFMVAEDTPMIWRGPMVTSALQQLLNETNWENLDYLIVDLPPGTGDIQLTLAQRVPVSGVVIVTTPQDIALLDARKAVRMFEKVDMTVLGIIENMSTHKCSQCGHEEAIFGAGGGESMSQEYNLPLLGQLPLAMVIRADLDRGEPTLVADPSGDISSSYIQCARNTVAMLGQRPRSLDLDLPKIQLHNR